LISFTHHVFNQDAILGHDSLGCTCRCLQYAEYHK
jgi:hypothetical protein